MLVFICACFTLPQIFVSLLSEQLPFDEHRIFFGGPKKSGEEVPLKAHPPTQVNMTKMRHWIKRQGFTIASHGASCREKFSRIEYLLAIPSLSLSLTNVNDSAQSQLKANRCLRSRLHVSR